MNRLILAAAAGLACAAPIAVASAEQPTYEQPLSAGAVHDVQARLHALGYYNGPADGVWGGGTRTALERFQRDRRIAATGQLNQATVTALGMQADRLVNRGYEPRPAPLSEPVVANVGPQTTRAVQTRLREMNLYHGPVDGAWGRGTASATAEFQRERRLAVTGTPDRQTLAAMGFNPDSFLAGSSVPPADHLNREELQRSESGVLR
jgi:peptidoglycan hydrolase-like protein with peptidoglycan-binding domain